VLVNTSKLAASSAEDDDERRDDSTTINNIKRFTTTIRRRDGHPRLAACQPTDVNSRASGPRRRLTMEFYRSFCSLAALAKPVYNVRYGAIRYIYARSKADEMASLV